MDCIKDICKLMNCDSCGNICGQICRTIFCFIPKGISKYSYPESFVEENKLTEQKLDMYKDNPIHF